MPTIKPNAFSRAVKLCRSHNASLGRKLPFSSARLIWTRTSLRFQVRRVSTHLQHTPNALQASPDSPLFVTVGLLTSGPAVPIFLPPITWALPHYVDSLPTDSLWWKYLLYEMDALSQIEMSPGPTLVPCLINISLSYENRKLSLAVHIPRCCGSGTLSRILHQSTV